MRKVISTLYWRVRLGLSDWRNERAVFSAAVPFLLKNGVHSSTVLAKFLAEYPEGNLELALDHRRREAIEPALTKAIRSIETFERYPKQGYNVASAFKLLKRLDEIDPEWRTTKAGEHVLQVVLDFMAKHDMGQVSEVHQAALRVAFPNFLAHRLTNETVRRELERLRVGLPAEAMQICHFFDCLGLDFEDADQNQIRSALLRTLFAARTDSEAAYLRKMLEKLYPVWQQSAEARSIAQDTFRHVVCDGGATPVVLRDEEVFTLCVSPKDLIDELLKPEWSDTKEKQTYSRADLLQRAVDYLTSVLNKEGSKSGFSAEIMDRIRELPDGRTVRYQRETFRDSLPDWVAGVAEERQVVTLKRLKAALN